MLYGHGYPDWGNGEQPVAYLKYEDGFEPDETYLPFIRRGEDEAPHLTPEAEERFINEEIDNSHGFDIDFKKLRCIFNYQPLNFDNNDRFYTGEETTRELCERLTRESLEGFNKREGTKYQFVEFVKGNFNEARSPAIIFYITFKGKDPFHDEPKEFQTKICYLFHGLPKFTYCGLKPKKNVHSIETAEKEEAKKPRLTEELEQTNEIGGVVVV